MNIYIIKVKLGDDKLSNIKIYAFADEASESFDGQIKALLDNKLNGIEIRGVDGVNISDITIEKAREIKRKLDENNLTVWSIGSPIGKIELFDDMNKHIDKFKRTLEIGNILEAKNMRIFSFYPPKNTDPYDSRDEIFSRMNRLCEIADGSGIALCHENEKGIYGDTPERCLDLFDNFPSLKGIFDPANFVQCGVDTIEAWKLLKTHIHYMHIKDSKLDGNIVSAGSGAGNIPKIVAEYIEMGGRCFTMEPHLVEFGGLSALEREGEKSLVTAFSKSDERQAFDFACNTFKNIISEADLWK